MNFDKIKNNKNIYLYAGTYIKSLLVNENNTIPFVGLQLQECNNYNIQHNVLNKNDLYNNSVDIYQSEDVFEHIEYNELCNVINEIYRVLKPGDYLDFQCQIIEVMYYIIVQKKMKTILLDPNGGGNYDYENKKRINGGHLWFPRYESVKSLDKTKFEKITNFTLL